jgi:hypothetical protein
LVQWATAQSAALHSSGENHILQVALQPVDFSDRDLAELFYNGIEIV